MPRRSSPNSPAFPGHPLGSLGPSRLSDLVGPELGLLACCLTAVCLPACMRAHLLCLPACLHDMHMHYIILYATISFYIMLYTII